MLLDRMSNRLTLRETGKQFYRQVETALQT